MQVHEQDRLERFIRAMEEVMTVRQRRGPHLQLLSLSKSAARARLGMQHPDAYRKLDGTWFLEMLERYRHDFHALEEAAREWDTNPTVSITASHDQCIQVCIPSL